MQIVESRTFNSFSSPGSGAPLMKTPRVSICLPNLNNRPFLEERLATIVDQTFRDWELVIYDNQSEDGAWEFFQKASAKDPRVRIAQSPRQGMYANWNNCVRAARGEYVYIATSDDTMAADCLEKLVDALDANPTCDLAHCNLRMFGSDGSETASGWWPKGSLFARSSGELLSRPHLRRAPFDGLLHLSGDTVYTSITQLLIRRSLFDRIGLFEPQWGSLGDFNWNMRAGLVANTIHIPSTWGGWRQHTAQATASATFGSSSHIAEMDDMIDHAIAAVSQLLNPRGREALVGDWSPRMRDMRHIDLAMGRLPTAFRRRMFLTGSLMAGSWFARWHILNRLRKGPGFSDCLGPMMLEWLEEAGVTGVLQPVEPSVGAGANWN